MIQQLSRNRSQGLTLIDVMTVIAVLVIVSVIFLLSVKAGSRSSRKFRCGNNLKQVGMAYNSWAADHGGGFPMEVSMTNGGTLEFTGSRAVFLHYLVLSNELKTPKLLYCPSDRKREAASNFSARFRNNRISYFVGIDAHKGGQLFLSGDHNLTNGSPTHLGILELSANRSADWTGTIHEEGGNIGLADGSVQQTTSDNLQKLIRQTGLATNRLAMP